MSVRFYTITRRLEYVMKVTINSLKQPRVDGKVNGFVLKANIFYFLSFFSYYNGIDGEKYVFSAIHVSLKMLLVTIPNI